MAGLMPKVFEEANLSGELRLSGRKLKDFPKAAAKFNLSDTVIAGNTLTLFNFYRYAFVGIQMHGIFINLKAAFNSGSCSFP